MNISAQKTALEELRTELLSDFESLRGRLEGSEEYDENGTESDQPTHEADAATPLFERERDSSMESAFGGRIKDVDRALVKIADGTYLICDRCGLQIGEERLEASPESVLCLSCQSIEEGL
jgi:RNA polymerase-binding transcription factor DksA